MILELSARQTYYDLATGIAYMFSGDGGGKIDRVDLYGPGHPFVRNETIVIPAVGNWGKQETDERTHVEPFATFSGDNARRLLGFLMREVVESDGALSEKGLDNYVAGYLEYAEQVE